MIKNCVLCKTDFDCPQGIQECWEYPGGSFDGRAVCATCATSPAIVAEGLRLAEEDLRRVAGEAHSAKVIYRLAMNGAIAAAARLATS